MPRQNAGGSWDPDVPQMTPDVLREVQLCDSDRFIFEMTTFIMSRIDELDPRTSIRVLILELWRVEASIRSRAVAVWRLER